ncbi:hypothetical protein tinsulaeT_11610 [Thalassotalea insulae]|uniref:MipA/OmpV family protein n=1 Tax=Thalassotalea insulae TaxID=2056778 RepID=A0ABQ6GT14_9GAMM|nr:MipA/OmpV family protein [Thalassotalea insulae]GLX77821.1 hypothetical protein tinsulaeT_11610 [Thalassotalea insulae]
MLNKLSCCLLLVFCLSSYAAGNDKKPSNESTVFNETFSWQAQMGFSLHYNDTIIEGVEQSYLDDYINLSLLFDFYYKGFFIQTNYRRLDTHILGAEIGYQLINNDDWELDIITRSYIGGFDSAEIIENSDKDLPIMEGLKVRDLGDGLAIRYSRYFNDSYFSVDVANLAALSDAKGWVIDAFYSHLIPYRNWDIYLNTGLSIYSSATTNYYIGIGNSEVLDIRPHYQTGTGGKIQFEFYAQRPLSESWTFNVGFSQSYYSNNIADSPIVDSQGATQLLAGVIYVF